MNGICSIQKHIALAESSRCTGIPKLIHQTWRDATVPEHWASGALAWQSLHPEWTYLLWTDADIKAYILERHTDDWPLFEALSWPIQRVDLWRYYVLRDFGGVYADLDIKPVRPVDGLMGPGHVFLVPSANTSGVFTNAFMLSDTSREAYDFWTSVIDSVKAYVKSRSIGLLSAMSRHVEIMTSTGPLALTSAASASRWPITVLPGKLWNPFELSLAEEPDLQDQQALPEAIVRILPGSSWHASDSTLFSYVHTHRTLLLAVLALIVGYYVLRSEHVVLRFAALKQYVSRRRKV